ncbi:MAG TPA: FAD binding domain-containing protein [Petrotogaceae bacterium]|nr:FAD binding domain-containing protein [Petrotogaceae bacterium]
MRIFSPVTLDQALLLRSELKCTVLSGGTDLMLKKQFLLSDEHDLLMLQKIEELHEISVKDGITHIGACATQTDILESSLLWGVFMDVVSCMSCPSIRNLATIGGNICNASPAGDLILLMSLLDANVVVQSLHGRKTIKIHDFITGPGKTVLKEDELLTEFCFEDSLRSYSYFYKKVGTRKANALSKLSFAGAAKYSGNTVSDIRIAIGAVAPVVVRSAEIEKLFSNRSRQELNDSSYSISKLYEKYLKPIDDQRSNAMYRKKVSLNLLKYYIERVI